MQFSAPETVKAALSLLEADPGAFVMAGGTDLIVQMQSGLRSPEHVIDLKRIPELSEVTRTPEGGWRIGAAVPGAVLFEHAGLKADWPGFVEATDLIGSMQVQGRATPAGNLCNASPAADSVPAMISAGATVSVMGPQGDRTVAVEDIPLAPGKTSLAPAEMIVAINLPSKPERSGDAYLRFTPRTEMDIAVVGTGVFLAFDQAGAVSNARVALGAVAPTAMLVGAAGDALVGSQLDDAAIERAVAAARAACAPIDDKRGTAEYRIHTAGVMLKRTIAIAAARAKSER